MDLFVIFLSGTQNILSFDLRYFMIVFNIFNCINSIH